MSFATLSNKKVANPVLVQLAETVDCQSCNALDIGAGPLVESKFLLEKGYSVDALDKDPESARLAHRIENEKFSFFHTDILDFDFKENTYDLVVSLLTFPFIGPAHFNDIFDKVLKSLKPHGYMCLSLFGDRDGWVDSRSAMTFLTRREVEGLFLPFEIIRFIEEDKTGLTLTGEEKKWHIYTIVAKKI